MGAQGSIINLLSPFKNYFEYIALTVRHCGITHGPSGKLWRQRSSRPGFVPGVQVYSLFPLSSGLGLAGSHHTHPVALQNINPSSHFFFNNKFLMLTKKKKKI